MRLRNWIVVVGIIVWSLGGALRMAAAADDEERGNPTPPRLSFLTRRGGAASAIPAGGEQTDVGADQQVVLEGNDEHAELNSGGAPEPDDWDKWNLERTDSLGETPKSTRYLPRGVSGGDDL